MQLLGRADGVDTSVKVEHDINSGLTLNQSDKWLSGTRYHQDDLIFEKQKRMKGYLGTQAGKIRKRGGNGTLISFISDE